VDSRIIPFCGSLRRIFAVPSYRDVFVLPARDPFATTLHSYFPGGVSGVFVSVPVQYRADCRQRIIARGCTQIRSPKESSEVVMTRIHDNEYGHFYYSLYSSHHSFAVALLAGGTDLRTGNCWGPPPTSTKNSRLRALKGDWGVERDLSRCCRRRSTARFPHGAPPHVGPPQEQSTAHMENCSAEDSLLQRTESYVHIMYTPYTIWV